MTRDEARSLIRKSLNEDSEKFYKDSEINDWLKFRYKRVTNSVAESFEGFFGETSYTDLVSGQKRYALPSNFKKLQQIRVNYDGNWRVASRITKAELDPSRTYSTAYPFYLLLGDEINIEPAPSANVTSGLEIDQIKEPAELTSDTQTWDVPTAYHHLVVYGALADILPKDNQLQKANMYDLRFEQGIQDMQDQLASRDDSAKSVTMDEGGEDFVIT